jgi:hypothetical protein
MEEEDADDDDDDEVKRHKDGSNILHRHINYIPKFHINLLPPTPKSKFHYSSKTVLSLRLNTIIL